MSINNISLIQNHALPRFTKIKEKFDVYIPGMIEGIPNRNGFVWCLSGSPGSGKTNLLLNMFKSKTLYRHKFHNIFYISPASSFSSVEKHPFADHDKLYHDLNVETLQSIYSQLDAIKKESCGEKKTTNQDDSSEEENEIQYSCVIIDDYADQLKNNDIANKLKRMLIKSRHLNCSFIFTSQSFILFPKQLRKLLFNITIFKPQNKEEFESICKEVINFKKDDALLLSDFVFNEEYNHLDIDLKTNKLYKNFHELVFNMKS
jgi:hypothetical protein